MGQDKTGSYQVDTLSNPDDELSRLKQQGEMFRQLEIDTLTKCGLMREHRVLELGCGPGYVTPILAELAIDGEMISVDNDQNLISLLQQNDFPKPKNGFKALHASADNLPVEENWSDFTYARFLMQHVPSPLEITNEAFRCTRTGGLFCAVDSDDGLITYYPEKPELEQFLFKVKEKQAEYGGDRLVGRKLFHYMHRAGFVNIKANVITLTTAQIPPQALFGILFGFKGSLLGNKETVGHLIAQLSKEAASGEFLLSAGVFVVTGEKP